MSPTPMTEIQRQLTRTLTLSLLSVTATPADLAGYLTHVAGSPAAGLLLLNEAHDEIDQQLASVALLLRTNRA